MEIRWYEMRGIKIGAGLIIIDTNICVRSQLHQHTLEIEKLLSKNILKGKLTNKTNPQSI